MEVISNTQLHVYFRKIFVCHRSGHNKLVPNDSKKRKSKNTMCQAEIDIVVKLNSSNTRKKDEYIKV